MDDFHSLRSRRSGSGQFTDKTALGLFIPLGLVTLRVLSGYPEVTRTDHILGLAVALLIHAAILVRVVSRKRQLSLPAVPATGRA